MLSSSRSQFLGVAASNAAGFVASDVAPKLNKAPFALHGSTLVAPEPRFVKPKTENEAKVFRFNQLFQERTLLNAWHNNFVVLQRQIKDLEGFSQFGQDAEDRLRVVAAISDKYCADLHSFILKSARFIERAEKDAKQELEDTASIIHDVYCLWRLCHIMFVDPSPNPTNQLASWLRTFFHEPELQTTDDSSAMYRSLLRGDMPALEPWFEHLHVKVADLIQSAPTLNFDTTLSEADFNLRFDEWRAQVKAVKSELRGVARTEDEIVLAIMSGDDRTITASTADWKERLVGKLLFSVPTIAKDSVPAIVASCNPEAELFDEMLVAALNMDVTKFLQLTNQAFELSWFQAHLADVVMHAGKLAVLRSESLGYDLREHYLLEYASTLQTHTQLWHLAASYLVECPEFGAHYLRQLIRSQPITTDQIALKLVAICDRANLQDEKVAIFNTLAMQALRKANVDRNGARDEENSAFLGTAIHWFAKAGNTRRLAQLSTLVLEQFHQFLKENPAQQPSMDDLDSIAENVSDILVCNEVTFLVKFRDLVMRLRLLDTADAADAAVYRSECLEIVVRLLESNVVPPRFRVPLLHQVLPILELESVVLSTQDVRMLMESLEETAQSHLADHYLDLLSDSAVDVEAIRITLGNSLKRAIIAEVSA